MNDQITYNWVIKEQQSEGLAVCKNYGNARYMTCNEMRAYIDGTLIGKEWYGDWVYLECEEYWIRYKESDAAMTETHRTHVAVYNARTHVCSIDGTIVKRNENKRFRCVRRYINDKLSANTLKSYDFLVDTPTIVEAQNYIDKIFELHNHDGWEGDWFFSDQENGWLKFRNKHNDINENKILELEHFYITDANLYYNEDTGHNAL